MQKNNTKITEVAGAVHREDLYFYRGSDIFKEQDFPLRIYFAIHPASLFAHSHDFVELVFVINGQGIHHFHRGDGAETDTFSCGIMQGDILIMRPGEVHSFVCSNNLQVYNVIFQPELILPEQAELAQLPGLKDFYDRSDGSEDVVFRKLHLPMAQRLAAEALAKKINEEMTLQKPGYRLNSRSMLLEFLVLIGRLTPHCLESSGNLNNTLYVQQAINRVICYMEKNVDKAFSLNDLSAQAHFSPSYLSHLFKLFTGMSLWEYLTHLRLEKVKSMLVSSDIPIAEIAFLNGFCDSSYLAKVFRQHEGLSPKAYRSKLLDQVPSGDAKAIKKS